jgi:hypothetical protein
MLAEMARIRDRPRMQHFFEEFLRRDDFRREAMRFEDV